MALRLWLLSILAVSILSIQVQAQNDLGEQRKNLTGASGRAWVFERFTITVSREGSCSGGESWKFKPDGHVVVEKCVAGKIETTGKTWSMEKDGIDYIVKVGDAEYRFIYSKPGKRKHQMRLRTASGVKATGAADLVFTFEGN